jgi:hypothetical protein
MEDSLLKTAWLSAITDPNTQQSFNSSSARQNKPPKSQRLSVHRQESIPSLFKRSKHYYFNHWNYFKHKDENFSAAQCSLCSYAVFCRHRPTIFFFLYKHIYNLEAGNTKKCASKHNQLFN